MNRSMPRVASWIVFVATWFITQAALAGDARTDAEREAETFFEIRVRPVLVAHCFECHGAKKQESGLRLDSRAGILRGGEGGRRIVEPGAPEKSPLVEAIAYQGDIQMPPDGRLNDRQVDDLTEWVRLGLPWPGGADEVRSVDVAEKRVDAARRSHWSLQPVRRRTPPVGLHRKWVGTEVDAWIVRRLDQAKLTPSPPAGRHTLIRRLTYDLTGLPPTSQQVAAFVADRAPDAYERLVDRLLASPRYRLPGPRRVGSAGSHLADAGDVVAFPRGTQAATGRTVAPFLGKAGRRRRSCLRTVARAGRLGGRTFCHGCPWRDRPLAGGRAAAS
ncbi:MAG: DUF1549 domain-containing protein [Pirellulales bacterium]